MLVLKLKAFSKNGCVHVGRINLLPASFVNPSFIHNPDSIFISLFVFLPPFRIRSNFSRIQGNLFMVWKQGLPLLTIHRHCRLLWNADFACNRHSILFALCPKPFPSIVVVEFRSGFTDDDCSDFLD
ncbi:unnamed protein product [Citrullus colocynthis]|uniref:Uncharacterized protein n=1 Tax=Citrullus colocynthis TaxID=252529 RepID=A0ABP0YKV2_9ROSI